MKGEKNDCKEAVLMEEMRKVFMRTVMAEKRESSRLGDVVEIKSPGYHHSLRNGRK